MGLYPGEGGTYNRNEKSVSDLMGLWPGGGLITGILRYVSCKRFSRNVLFFSHVAFNLSLIYMKCREQFNWVTKLINWNELLPLILLGLLHTI